MRDKTRIDVSKPGRWTGASELGTHHDLATCKAKGDDRAMGDGDHALSMGNVVRAFHTSAKGHHDRQQRAMSDANDSSGIFGLLTARKAAAPN